MPSISRHPWAINGDFLALKPTGVARYALEVTRALNALVAEDHPLTRNVELTLLAPRPTPPNFLEHIPTRVIPEFNRPRLPQFWLQAQLPRAVQGGLLSFCNLAPVLVRRQIVCIHDLHTRIMPESYGLLFRMAHRTILPALGRRAALITTVSGLSRDHLIRFGIAPASKVVVAHNGSDHARRWDATRSRLELGPRPFVLALGRKQAYKNGALVWRIAAPLDARGIDVYMAGDIDEPSIRQLGSQKPRNVRLLGRISDDDLALVLSRAVCFVFPSRIEGFGLPAVEAMALGCPVIASTAPCLPEVCGDAAIYADPDDPGGWIAAIDRLRLDGGLRPDLIAKGYARAALYTWRSTAKTYLSLMARLDRQVDVSAS
jgi:glycosyltransferase involved in cell wall biosynthesis